jgi:acyl transferase domain-containing protein
VADVFVADPVAVVGMGIAVPGASSPEQLWRLLVDGTSTFTEPGRFEVESFWSADPAAPERAYARTAGFITDFRPHPALAAELDAAPARSLPHPGLWLRHSLYQATEGLRLRARDRCLLCVGLSPTGSPDLEDEMVRVGLHGAADGDTVRAARAVPHRIGRAVAAGILPEDTEVLVVDTACSSSLYAIDAGLRALRSGECELAVCGGAFALTPYGFVLLAAMAGQSASGQVRPYGTGADGTMFSDAAGLVALETLSRARANGDRVLGLLLGSGCSADGRGKAMHAPLLEGQRLAIRRALESGRISPGAVSWVVGHGAGTAVGDAVEVAALHEAYGADGRRLLTSTKAVIGHGVFAAGVCSVIHALLAMREEVVPGQSHHDGPAERLALGGRLAVPVRAAPWPAGQRPRVAGVSGFGLGGGNAHLLVADAVPGPAEPAGDARPAEALAVVGWAAHLPGDPTPEMVLRWLRGGRTAPALAFEPRYPMPDPAEFRIPPGVLRAGDRGQVMALRLFRALAGALGGVPETLCATTGVVCGQTGPSHGQLHATLRCHLESARPAANDDPHASAGWAAVAERVRTTFPAATEDTLAGTVANAAAARVANYFDLHGATACVDAGADSGLAALRFAQLQLDSGSLDLAAVLAMSTSAEPELAALLADLLPPGVRHLAEGGFGVAVCRVATAREHGWPVLARIRVHARPSLGRRPVRLAALADRSYLAADGMVALLASLTDCRGPGVLATQTYTVTRIDRIGLFDLGC